ncbi:hypothetical protein [Pseudomonas aeruginosa]|uniref:hypothetical protein n=1 Tax=Pseudomonas aeruginosa TaxID=287 RepID=UPI001E3553E8|nr:hypothetical protein [Pseudomonas aeruginosa]
MARALSIPPQHRRAFAQVALRAQRGGQFADGAAQVARLAGLDHGGQGGASPQELLGHQQQQRPAAGERDASRGHHGIGLEGDLRGAGGHHAR